MEDEADESFRLVTEFLNRFYHEEPSDTIAATKALNALRGQYQQRWELARAFRSLTERHWLPNQLRDYVRREANRFAKSDDEGREFLQKIYHANALDVAFKPDDR